MALGSRPFAYNTGATIPGTIQIGDLAVGTPTNGFAATGLDWWNGPSESAGYIIAKPVPSTEQPTPVFGHAMLLSTTYKPTDILLTNGNKTAYVTNLNYVQSVLADTLIDKNDKVMFSLTFTSTNPSASSNSWIGVGTRSMNYNGPFDGFPGNDANSIGFNQAGELWFNNGMIQSGLTPWNSNDRIDVAIDHSNDRIWIRVGGNLWNNDPTADPSTNQGGAPLNGLTSFYPVLSPGTGSGVISYGTMALASTPFSPLPSGFQFAGSNQTAAVAFLRSHVRTDASFVTLVNEKFGQSFALTGAGATTAKNWLNTNGYWTSY
jgi:hypothetical protein